MEYLQYLEDCKPPRDFEREMVDLQARYQPLGVYLIQCNGCDKFG